MQAYVTNEEPSADCNKCRDDCDFFWYMQIMVMFVTYSQQSEKKGVAPFHLAHFVQKSVLNFYMIWEKCVYYNRRGVSRHVTLSTLHFPK